jgi:hypothetical protein
VDTAAFCWVSGLGALAQTGAESKAAILKASAGSAASAAPAPNATSGMQHIRKRKERFTMLAPSVLLGRSTVVAERWIKILFETPLSSMPHDPSGSRETPRAASMRRQGGRWWN